MGIGFAQQLDQPCATGRTDARNTPEIRPGVSRARVHRASQNSTRNRRSPSRARLVELAWVARFRSAGRKDHGPGHVADPTVELAVDEIGDPAEEQPDRAWRRRRCRTSDEETHAAPAGEPDHRDEHAQQAAVKSSCRRAGETRSRPDCAGNRRACRTAHSPAVRPATTPSMIHTSRIVGLRAC